MVRSRVRLLLMPVLTVAVIVIAILLMAHREKIVPFVYSLF